MAGKTLDISEVIKPDQMGTAIANQYTEWNMLRAAWKTRVDEVQRYIYATDTSSTTNSTLPWKNKTTLPKLCQIRDNLYANYIASLFPKTDLLEWQGATADDQAKRKTDVLESAGNYFISTPSNREVMQKLVLDYIDYGNCFATVDWTDRTSTNPSVANESYVGPQFVRVSPLDIVFNPTAPSFAESPKIIRSLVTIGELKRLIDANSIGDDKAEVEAAFEYLRSIRAHTQHYAGDDKEKNGQFAVDGFTSFIVYMHSSYCELLTFYGDYYDVERDKFYQNHIITVADRHKVIGVRPNPSITGTRVHHIGWRPRQDNVWAMGPLENLVGMQYRIDHLENLKADVFDLIAAPPLMVKGLVEDFVWGPFARINVDVDGEIEVLAPQSAALNADMQIQLLEQKMEEFAGSPKEAAGFRTPGEKTAYEVQRLENASNRIFYAKTKQFEELFFEPLINDALELARRRMDSRIVARVFNDETNATDFLTIEPKDLAGVGRLKPVAARNFADKAEKVQNVNSFFASVLGQDLEIKAHFSTIALARMFEELLDLEAYEIVKPYVRLTEQAEAQSLQNAAMENVAAEAATPAGVMPDDFAV